MKLSRIALLGVAVLSASTDAGILHANPAPPGLSSQPNVEHALRAAEHTLSLDYAEAKKELAAADPDSLVVATEKARVQLYEADCDGALMTLSRPEILKIEQAAALADIARGCARVTAATVMTTIAGKDLEIRFQDELDEPLAPIIADTVVKARDALTRDLGVTWPKPTRITVVRDLMSLSAMTGLPQKAAQTTGTVAVAKWGRVTLLSPRASHHGYAWRDTVAHELTHLAVTRASSDRAPLWLQEGVAKREEIRWREPGPFDDRPPADTVVLRGIELKLDLALDKLGPSIAMLPSADAAMVAFSEVTSFVHYFADTAPPNALPRLLLALREKKSVDLALTEASGMDLKGWDVKWRAYLASKPADVLPPLFGLGKAIPNMRELGERMRLAELLMGRDHPTEALLELDRIGNVGSGGKLAPGVADVLADPSVRHVRARALEAIDKQTQKESEALVADPKETLSSYGPWWAIRGRWARDRKDDGLADTSFSEAVAADPLDVESACQTLDISKNLADPVLAALCDAARHRDEPGLGKD